MHGTALPAWGVGASEFSCSFAVSETPAGALLRSLTAAQSTAASAECPAACTVPAQFTYSHLWYQTLSGVSIMQALCWVRDILSMSLMKCASCGDQSKLQLTFRAASAWALRIFSGDRHAERMLSRSCCPFAIAYILTGVLLSCTPHTENWHTVL